MDQFSPSELLAKLSTPEGQKLLQLMQKDGGAAFKKAATAAKAGNYEDARSILRPLLEGTDAEALASVIYKKFG